MLFDPDNVVMQLCARGMEQEMAGNFTGAEDLFAEAWEKAASDSEKFTAAHYVARQQKSVADKLVWDQTALRFAKNIGAPEVNSVYPSLYLNIAKCYEDMNDFSRAFDHYSLAMSFVQYLEEDGYGKMIRSGIEAGLERTKLHSGS